MTREGAKEYLIDISYKLGTMGIEYLNEKDGIKMREAIEILDQEPILDKVRAEIEQVSEEENKVDEKWAQGLKYALKIIDKYNTESEVKI